MRRFRVISSAFFLLLPLTVILPTQSSTKVFSAGFPPELDPVSAECMYCHDGSEGIHIGLCFLSQLGTACGSHIVSADYAALAERKKDLNPVSSLPPELVLFEGMITCVTCHGEDPHIGDTLVLDYQDSVLCRACHRK